MNNEGSDNLSKSSPSFPKDNANGDFVQDNPKAEESSLQESSSYSSLSSSEEEEGREQGHHSQRHQLLQKKSTVKFISRRKSKEEEQLRSYYQSLPLRTQIRLLIEGALDQQLKENRSKHTKRPLIRRLVDTFCLRLLVFMMKFHREICLFFLVMVSMLASIKNSPVKTRPTPDPKPFFDNPKSLEYIQDLYKGEYVDIVQNKINLGPAFVFYYAPWDSESVAARNVFVNVAKYFGFQLPHSLRFYAVNCWWPQGECRKNYKNLSHFPIFVAHLDRQTGIVYSGPIRTELIIKFLNSVLKPLTRIDTEDELWRFRAHHDAIMLAHFNFTENESVSAYETYRQMALRSFESDPFGQVGFGIFLRPELAQKYFLTSSNVISLVLFNEIHTAKWTSDKDPLDVRGPVVQVANWILERTRKTPITWAYQIRTGFANRPVALGPTDLADELSKGPVMLLITRRYFPSAYSPFYSQLKEVALDYFNCNKSGNVTRLRRTTHQINSEWITLWNSVAKICGLGIGPPSDTCILLEEQLHHWNTKKSGLRRESLASYEAFAQNFTGFSCSSDRQFRFFAVDPVDLPHFIQLGFSGLGFRNDSDPLLFVIDAENDIILPFSTFNITALAQLIYNYTNDVENNEDPMHFISSYWSDPSVIKTKDSFSFSSPTIPSNDNHQEGYSMVQQLLGDKEEQDEHFEQEYRQLTKAHEVIHQNVLNINSATLLAFLRKNPFHKIPSPMFLMYTAKFCGACGVAATSFVELARFINDYYRFGLNMTFAKIDMLKNSLPASLSPDKLPTFAYFPQHDPNDVRLFPIDEPITTKTLLQFLLGELDPDTRIKLSLLSPGCSSSSNNLPCSTLSEDEDPHFLKQHHTECIKQQHLTNSTTKTSPRENCISVNRMTVADRLQHIFNEIQHSQPHSEELRVNLDSLKTQDLDHLRSMRITLDVA